jgi:flagellar biosynthesis protein FlhB
MSEDQDRESKTEEPTEKKLQDAIDKGNVPLSREAVTFGSLAAIFLAARLVIPAGAEKITEVLRLLLANVGLIHLEVREDADFLISAAGYHVALAVFPVMAVVAAGGLIAGLVQNLPQANGERIRPQYNRISVSSGWKRLFGFQGLVEFLKSLAKLVAVGAVAALMVRTELSRILDMLATEPAAMPRVILDLAARVLTALCLVALVLAIADLALSRFKWRRQLRMTRQEIKDEFKQAEGDPLLKSRIRSIARQRLSRRMMARVPQATVVITNPTHYAVALRYLREEGGAPVVVAKGIDHLALRIREVATANTIPIVENRPLARALYDQADVDQMIPAEFYKAVAEIIHFLQLRKMYTAPAANR